MMGSNGILKVCHIQKDFVDERTQSDEPEDKFAVPVALKRTQLFKHPQRAPGDKRKSEAVSNKDKMVAFDFMNFFESTKKFRAVTIGVHQEVHVQEVYKSTPQLVVGGGRAVALSDWRARRFKARHGQILSGVRSGSVGVVENIIEKQSARRRGSLHYANAAVRKEAADTWQDWEDQIDKMEDGFDAVTVDEYFQPGLKRTFEANMRKRCEQGYLLDANKNSQITAGDPVLSLFWRWVNCAIENAEDDEMVALNVDFGFLGVQNIMNANLGAEPANRSTIPNPDISYAINWLAAHLGLTGIEVKEGFLTARRRLALHSIGLRTDNLKQRVQQLSMAGKNAEAALRALILCDNSLVLGSLTNGPRRTDMTFVFDDVHKWLTTDQMMDEERQKMIRIKLSQEEDPFVHAIYYIMLSNNRDAMKPFEKATLPFHYRLAIALRYVEDDLLRNYIDDTTREAVRGGEIDKIMLTGLSEDGLKLITKYLNVTADLQTAVLAASYVAPKYIRHSRKINKWRAAYRNRLNAWGLYIQRCAFDVEASKLAIDEKRSLLNLTAPQIGLRCGNCDGPFISDQYKASPMTASTGGSGARHFGGGVLGGPSDVTQCPRCGVKLPHCSVCDMPTGVLDPLTRGGEEREKQSLGNGRDPRDDLLELCMTCDHVYHRGCAEKWFGKHVICPAVGCDCHCDELDEDDEDDED